MKKRGQIVAAFEKLRKSNEAHAKAQREKGQAQLHARDENGVLINSQKGKNITKGHRDSDGTRGRTTS